MAIDVDRKRSASHGGGQIQHAGDVASIEAALESLSQQDTQVTRKLETLVKTQGELTRYLDRLELARAQLGPQVTTLRTVSNGMLSDAASTASRISGAVQRLDTEQSAVKATLAVVEQVSELKSCVLGLHGAMEGTQDWEAAATYLQRALEIPRDVVDGPFAEEIVPTAEVPDTPRTTLDNAAANLCTIFLREFDKAAREGNGSEVTRLFKLFPLIDRRQVGLDAYGRYVCGGVSSRARSNMSANHKGEKGLFYVINLTRLFEHIAQIIDGHEPVVTRHYGKGMMEPVIERLQVECDLQGGIILDTWADESQLTRKLTDVKSYAFTFLVQSFLPAPRPSATFRPNSPSLNQGATPRRSEDELVDMKAVDSLLNEMAMMLGRWALYAKFVASKAGRDEPERSGSMQMPSLILNSSFQRKTLDILLEPFNSMTVFYFRRSVEKAFQMDEAPADLNLNLAKPLSGSPPYITSAVDDIMYILNQVVQRSMGTAQRGVIASVIPAISRVLGSDFYGMIQRKMRDESYPKGAVQGTLPPENLIVAFIVLMNNLDVSTDYVRRIIDTQLPKEKATSEGAQMPPSLAELYPFADDASFVEKQLRSLLSSFEDKTAALLAEATEVLLQRVLRPRLRPVLVDTFREIDYAPDADDEEEQEGAEIEQAAPRFDRGWTAFMQPIKRISTDANFEDIHAAAVEHLSRMLEKRTWSYRGRVNALGAIRMERDMTAIINVAIRGAKYAMRDAFTRVLQMLLVLNMDEDEWQELIRTGGEAQPDTGGAVAEVDWRLTDDEKRRVRRLLEADLERANE